MTRLGRNKPSAVDKNGEHLNYIRQTYELARRTMEQGNHPFGALFVHRGEVVLTAKNSVKTLSDPTRHAELNLIQLAAQQLAPVAWSELILYTSTEPCAMCAGAIYWSGCQMVVFGTSAATAFAIANPDDPTDFAVPSQYVFKQGSRPITLIGPVADEEGAALHAEYWRTQ